MRRPIAFAILGYVGTLALLAVVGIFVAHNLEGRVERVESRQHSDHRHITAIERGHPLGSGGGGALQSPSGGQQQAPSTGGAPGNSGPGTPHAPGGGQPAEEPAPNPTPAPERSESANPPGLVESVGPTVGGAVSGLTETACSTPAQLHLPCP